LTSLLYTSDGHDQGYIITFLSAPPPLATKHFEAGQKLYIALRASNAALPDAGLLV
jgi:hypothetical protein